MEINGEADPVSSPSAIQQLLNEEYYGLHF